jgi:uncharacterized protein (DUF433 family)
MTFDRIAVDPEIMAGVPCIAGTRIPVATVVREMSNAASTAELIAEYPQLTQDDIRQALEYASARVAEQEVDLDLGA